MADLIAASVAILRDTSLERVFGTELPRDEHDHMPRKCAVVRGSGGGGSQGWMPTGTRRIDVRCYGATPWEASQVEKVVASTFQFWTIGYVTYGTGAEQTTTRVHWFREAGGGNEMRDPDTKWPLVLSVWQVHGDRY